MPSSNSSESRLKCVYDRDAYVQFKRVVLAFFFFDFFFTGKIADDDDETRIYVRSVYIFVKCARISLI